MSFFLYRMVLYTLVHRLFTVAKLRTIKDIYMANVLTSSSGHSTVLPLWYNVLFSRQQIKESRWERFLYLLSVSMQHFSECECEFSLEGCRGGKVCLKLWLHIIQASKLALMVQAVTNTTPLKRLMSSGWRHADLLCWVKPFTHGVGIHCCVSPLMVVS